MAMIQFVFLSALALLFPLSYGKSNLCNCIFLMYGYYVGQERGTVVLSQAGIRNVLFASGLVEVYGSTGWQLVCYDGITQREADVICHQLGYVRANSFSPQPK